MIWRRINITTDFAKYFFGNLMLKPVLKGIYFEKKVAWGLYSAKN